MKWTVFVVAATALGACGTEVTPSMGSPDAAPLPTVDADAGFQTAPHAPFPQLALHGGGVLEHVQLVTVTFPGYASKDTVEQFGDYIVGSDWYTTVGADYGIGAGVHLAKIVLPSAAPTTVICYAELDALMQQRITDGTLPMPPATGNQILYILYVPQSVPLCMALMSEYGHHTSTAVNGRTFPYAVILDNGKIADTTSTASHELAEAATDAYNSPNDGYWLDPAQANHWIGAWGEENGDLCQWEPLQDVGGFAVQPIWSDTAARAGGNPCIPFPAGGGDWQAVDVSPATVPTVSPGETLTFTLTGWSTGPVADWDVAIDPAYSADLAFADLNATVSTTKMNNGRTATLTLHVPANAPSGKYGGVSVDSGPYYRAMPVAFRVK